VGLMIHNGRARVVEFNVRFGDPEAQVVLPLIDCDVALLFKACAEGQLKNFGEVKLFQACAVTVVMASQGYPDSYQTGEVIEGIEDFGLEKQFNEGLVVFHGATKRNVEGKFATSGGRVLSVTAVGYDDDLKGTIAQAYNAVHHIAFNGAYYRSDIGQKGLREMEPREIEE
jgi:phosphoribosylamine--glycine ligase